MFVLREYIANAVVVGRALPERSVVVLGFAHFCAVVLREQELNQIGLWLVSQ
jgi:hypothetical protein